MTDADIHHDADSPRTTPADWEGAVLRRDRIAIGCVNLPDADRAPTKEQVAIELSPEVLAAFRAGGPGWRTRIDAVLKEWVRTHPGA